MALLRPPSSKTCPLSISNTLTILIASIAGTIPIRKLTIPVRKVGGVWSTKHILRAPRVLLPGSLIIAETVCLSIGNLSTISPLIHN
ncbi:hypothetical protein BDQ94DRAFT_148038 [Aspergillus welwitschiae]|uniref:Uncharacterized protein n=1 Tax=Aspergillus welwitschiae TaxID=1341132 RepID=A0A3F3PV64_9EURO|nr:hypothetical protein BDQ94DRAFT_148038 [Aspergillus welwitschiae]RDH30814.1 hypothetical protein BDQ94DRAFT_148038 [Aspergillus welwitschiae]